MVLVSAITLIFIAFILVFLFGIDRLVDIFRLIAITILLVVGGFLLPLFFILLITDEPFNFMMLSGPILLSLGAISYKRTGSRLAKAKHRIILIASIVMALLWILMAGSHYHPISAIIYAIMAAVLGGLYCLLSKGSR